MRRNAHWRRDDELAQQKKQGGSRRLATFSQPPSASGADALLRRLSDGAIPRDRV